MSDWIKSALFKLARKGAIVFLPVGKGKYLLQKEDNGDLRPPGGGLEKQDDGDLTECVTREIMEEFAIPKREIASKLKFLGTETREKFKGNGVYELKGHGLKPGTFQASNDPDEKITLTVAGLDDPHYTGPELGSLKKEAKLRVHERMLKDAHAGDMPSQPARTPNLPGEDPAKNPPVLVSELPPKPPQAPAPVPATLGGNPPESYRMGGMMSQGLKDASFFTESECRAAGIKQMEEEFRQACKDMGMSDEETERRVKAGEARLDKVDFLSEKDPHSSDKTASTTTPVVNADIPRTGPEAIAYALQNVDLDQKESEAHDIVKRRLKSKRPEAVKVLGVIQGLRRSGIKPADLMIHQVPVIPPQFRPYTIAGDVFIPGDANELYRDLINLRDLHGQLEQKLGSAGAAPNKLRIYDATKALYGLGEPTSPKTKERGVSGFVQKICGTNPKNSMIHKKLLSRDVDFVARSVITADPDLGMDELGMPEEMAWKLYSPYIQRRLVRGGMHPSDAIKHVTDRSPMADKALTTEMGERPVMYSRAPAWHKFSILGAWPKRIKGNAIATNLFVAAGLGADYDGDSGRFLLGIRFSSCRRAEYVGSYSTMLNKNSQIKLNEKVIHIQNFPHLEETKTETSPGVTEYDVPPDVRVYALNRDTRKHDWMPVTKFSVHENLQLWQVSMLSGKVIFTSEDHSLVGYKDGKLELIKPEDSVGMCFPKICNPRRKQPPIEHVIARGLHYDQPMEFKLKLNYKVGQWLGMIIGDGQTNDNQVCLSGKDDKVVNRALFTEIVQSDLLPYGGHVGHSDYESVSLAGGMRFRQRDVVSDKRWFTNWIRSYIGDCSLEKRIPDFSLNASDEHLWGIFDGLMSTDGSVSISHSKAKPQLLVNFATSSVDLVATMQSLLSRLDIRSSVTPSKSKLSGRDAFTVSISTIDLSKQHAKRPIHFNHPAKEKIFQENIGTVVTEGNVRGNQVPFPTHLCAMLKQSYANRTGWLKLKNGKTNYGPFGEYKSNGKWDRKIAMRELMAYRVGGGEWTQEFKDYWSLISDTSISWDIVTSASPLAERMTGWDITVPGAYTFALDDGTIVQDTMNVHLPSVASAVDDVKTKLMPSKMLWSIKDRDKVVPGLKQEQVLGLYQAQRRPAKTVHQFGSEDEALAAIRSGKVRLSDEVNIAGKK